MAHSVVYSNKSSGSSSRKQTSNVLQQQLQYFLFLDQRKHLQVKHPDYGCNTE